MGMCGLPRIYRFLTEKGSDSSFENLGFWKHWKMNHVEYLKNWSYRKTNHSSHLRTWKLQREPVWSFWNLETLGNSQYCKSQDLAFDLVFRAWRSRQSVRLVPPKTKLCCRIDTGVEGTWGQGGGVDGVPTFVPIWQGPKPRILHMGIQTQETATRKSKPELQTQDFQPRPKLYL